MGYDIYLRDPVTGKTVEVPGHLMGGGIYVANYHPERGLFTAASACQNNFSKTFPKFFEKRKTFLFYHNLV